MESSPAKNLTSMILVASPLLMDPNFRRTIIFLTKHSTEDGCLGFELNRPTDISFKLPMEPDLKLPVYCGGPVQPEALTLASLFWKEPPGGATFHAFTEDPDVLTIPRQYQKGLRAFSGYAGWSPGQLEEEIESQSWVVLAPTPHQRQHPRPPKASREIMREVGSLYYCLALAPDDPSRN